MNGPAFVLPIKEQLAGDAIFIVRDFLTPEECAALVDKSESIGFGESTVETGGGARVANTGVRNNGHATWFDQAEADALFDKARRFLPDDVEGMPIARLHDRLRFYRYQPGQTLKKHWDGHMESPGQRSFLTFMVYLNEGCAGGETIFYKGEGEVWVRVTPAIGTLLVFDHDILHEGAPVTDGVKYVLRSDLMFSK